MKKHLLILSAALLSCGIATIANGKSKEIYKNPKASVEQRVEDLLGKMTLEEKICQLQNRGAAQISDIGNAYKGYSYGCVHDMQMVAEDCAYKYKAIQKYMMDSTRLGIPIIASCEGVQGILQDGCTIYPVPLGLGSTFDPDLIEQMTTAAAIEAKAMGIHQILSPVLDIARELRWGRVEETYGEDPFLIAELGISFINGYKSKNIICTPKHFLAHGSPTGGLNCANVSGGERELRSLYLYPFQRVISESDPLSLMTCYSSYDGVATVGSPYYMTKILRDELKFRGYTYSDWGSVEHLHRFHMATESFAEAAKKALIAGTDMNIDDSYKYLDTLVKSGRLDVAYIDRAVRNILKVKFELGLFENPYGEYKTLGKVIHNQKDIDLSRKIASESIVLLENNNSILPLDMSKYKSIAVIGPNSNQTVFGDYSWPKADSTYGVTLYDGLKRAVGDKMKVVQATGCDWWSQDRSNFADAIKAADNSDLIVVAVGTRSTYLARSPKNVTSGEGFDLSSLELPGVQADLMKELKKCGKPIIVVLISGKPLVMSWAKENADAIIVQWYGGEQQGNALADVITGAVNPSGRLNVSFPRSTGNTPCYYNYLPTDRGHFGAGGSPEKPEGHYIFEKPYAQWAFGHGLSYTKFEYKDVKLNKREFGSADTLRVALNVSNVGQMDGKEVVQLYVRDKISSVATPIRQLKAFKKCFVATGGVSRVEFIVPIKELALYDESMNHVVEPGEFEIQIGKSSDDIICRETINVR